MTVPPLISVEDFFGPPVRSGATMSPDGNRMAFLAPRKNRLNVWIEDLSPDSEPRCVTQPTRLAVCTISGVRTTPSGCCICRTLRCARTRPESGDAK